MGKFDLETGAPAFLEEEKRALQVAEFQRAEADALSSLKVHPGWKILEKYLNESIDKHTEDLVLSEDVNKMLRLQEYIKAHSNVLAYVDAKILEGEKAFENLGLVEKQAEAIDPEEDSSLG